MGSVSFVVNAEPVWWSQEQKVEVLAVSPLRDSDLGDTARDHMSI